MATRKLIFAALVCGLAILLAGGVWLFSSSNDDAASSNGDLLQMGQSATIGGVTATVADAQTAGGDAVLIVDMSIAPDGPSEVTDLSTGWDLLSPTGAAVTKMPDAPPPATIESCTTATATPAAPARCAVMFTLSEPVGSLMPFTVVWERDGERVAWLAQ